MDREDHQQSHMLSQLPIADLLQRLEADRKSAEVLFDTSLGAARLWFRDGRLVDAEMDDVNGEAAIFRLLGASDGSYTIEYKPVSRLQVINEDAAALLGRRKRRADEWQRLLQQVPSLDTILSTSADELSLAQATLPSADIELIELVDGRRTIIEIVDESGFDAVAVIERLAWYLRAGLVRPSGKSVPPPRAQESVDDSSDASLVALAGSIVDGRDEAEPPPPPTAEPEPPARKSILPAPMLPVNSEALHASPRSRLRAPETQIGFSSPDRAAALRSDVAKHLQARGRSGETQPGFRPSRPPEAAKVQRLVSIPGASAVPVGQPARSVAPANEAEALLADGADSGRESAPVTERGPGPDPQVFAGAVSESSEPAPMSASGERAVAQPEAPSSPLSAPVSPARALLGRYEVLGRIARGGMGTVYLCRVTGEGGFRRLFALKVLRSRLSRNAAATRMFLQEARIAARIYDPHVVGLIDVGMHGSQPYLVMDYVEGGSFQELLRRHAQHRPPRLIVPILLDALAGLHAAHTLTEDEGAPLSLVHCDVSPHNMLVGIDGTCRLSDFGIAKAAAAVAPRGGVATHGKPAYLSPEQAEGRSFDRRVDIFSLGVVMWNALTGERLFDGADVKATLANVREKEIPLPSTVGLRPPACLDAICLQALARDPAVRYQSAEEMAADLRAVAIREELLAPSSDVARWVTSTFGEELQVRRLAVLDASRRAKAAGTTRSETLEADRASDPEVKEEPVPSAPPSGEASHTIILAHDKRKNRVVLGAAMLSVLVVIFALAWPNQLAKLFKLETARPSESKPSSFAPNLPSIRANRADTNPAPAPSGTVAETAPPTHVRVPSPKSETQ